ncbi:MAG: hypothetical protein NW223_19810 [Hyphomicrobiaceae bacterium]|nr:hypothetical protein [Hyphomicrobiaceae bacterium]
MAKTAIGCAAVLLLAIAIGLLLVETDRTAAEEPFPAAAHVGTAPSPVRATRRAALRCSPDLDCAPQRGEDVAILP